MVFANLGFDVVDEQHRFGVGQRARLRAKGNGIAPHTLVMTATPIPRSLALTLHGDLDVSTIDELPPGRTPVTTNIVRGDERERAYDTVRDAIANGNQAFVICPLVEESETLEAKSAVAEHERLQEHVFPELSLGLLHGRMAPKTKDRVMTAFRDGDYHVLVATSVVEVGIDVPNATVMVIEGADRFGLSQLHQFRGRVGRGQDASTCLLIADDVSRRVGNGWAHGGNERWLRTRAGGPRNAWPRRPVRYAAERLRSAVARRVARRYARRLNAPALWRKGCSRPTHT